MSSHLTISRPRKKTFLAGAFFAIFALLVQPVVTSNLPEAFAASEAVTSAVVEAAPTAVDADTRSGKFSVRLKNAAGANENVSSDVYIVVSSSSPTGRFASTATSQLSTANSAEYKYSAGSSVRSFYYQDATAGTHTITAELRGLEGVAPLTSTITVSNISLPQASTPPSAPVLTVSPATCSQPTNRAQLTGDATDFRWEFDDGVRLQGEVIQNLYGTNEFNIVEALQAAQQPVRYGQNDGQLVWYDRDGTKQDIFVSAASFTLVDPATLDCEDVTPASVTPIINAISPNEGYISGTRQRIDVHIANPEVVRGGVIQLNKVGNTHNDERANFPLQNDGDSWFAIIDTTDIKKGGNTRHEQGLHQGDGEYLYKVEVHHKFGHGPGKPWGYHGNGTSWNKPEYSFTVDNTAPTFSLTMFGKKDKKHVPLTDGAIINPDLFDAPSLLNTIRFSKESANDTLFANGEPVFGHGYNTDNDEQRGGRTGNIGTRFSEEDVYEIYTRDAAGNQSSSVTFTVDKTAPQAEIKVSSLAGKGDLHRDTVRVTGVVDPVEQNMKSHWIEVRNPDDTLSYSHNMNTSDLEYSFNLDTSAGDGKYHIRYVATDKAGNRNDVDGSTTRTITVDNTAPAISIAAQTNGRDFSGAVDDGDTRNYATVTFYELAEGGESSRVVLTDRATVANGGWAYRISEGNLALFTQGARYAVEARSYDQLENTTSSWMSYVFPKEPRKKSGSSQGGDKTGEVHGELLTPLRSNLPATSIMAATASPSTLGTAFGLSTATALAQTPASPQTQNNQEVLGLTTGSSEGSVLGVADESDEQWSLVNAAAAIITTFLSLMALAGLRRKTDEEDGRAPLRLFTIIPAAVALVAFFATETLSAPMVWVNMWTWLFGAAVILQIILVAAARRSPAGE